MQMMTLPTRMLVGPMRDNIPTIRLVNARREHQSDGDPRSWHELSALEQQRYVDLTWPPRRSKHAGEF